MPNTAISAITLIEDTSMLWDEYCLIRLSVQYRGRAVPLVWRVMRHGSSSVRFEVYQAMLKRAARLVPAGVRVCFLADRGFADIALMRYLRDELHWHFRIRLKRSSWIYRPSKGWKQLSQYHLACKEVVLLQGVKLTKTHAPQGCISPWGATRSVASCGWSSPTSRRRCKPFESTANVFKLRRNSWTKSRMANKIERSEIRSVTALSRLCFVMAVATLLLTVQGQQVVATGKRRWVDSHLSSRQQLFQSGLELVQGSVASRMALILHHRVRWTR